MAKQSKTERGFSVIDFEDLYGAKCSMQQSSLATDNAIWLGCDSGTHYQHPDGRVIPAAADSCAARMHLNRDQAKWLVKQLKNWIKTGEVELVQ